MKKDHGGTSDSLVATVTGAGALALSLLLAPLLLNGEQAATVAAPSPAGAVSAVAESYLEAWSQGDLTAMSMLLSATPPDFDTIHELIAEQLRLDDARFQAGAPLVSGDAAVVPFEASLDLAGLGTWSYQGQLDLVLGVVEPPVLRTAPVADEAEGAMSSVASPENLPLKAVDAKVPRWSVAWSPATIHPVLGTGQTLTSERVVADRAPLVDVKGTVLTGDDELELAALSSQVLGRLGGLDEAGAATQGQPYLPGDEVGTSGLQSAFESQLSGRPSGEVRIVDDEGELVEVVHVFAGEEPQPVQTTFDAEIQEAAEAALARLSHPAALVAIDAPTGQIRAVASRPTIGFNRALVGQYPPGSTFKVVTTTALLGAGVTPETPTTCPATTSVEGYRFSNAGGEVLGDIPFGMAFYRSCNTAFVGLADELAADDLVAAAEMYGFNGDFALPVASEAGSFPDPSGPIDQASAAIGQGRVTATPLQMATVAAAVASGTWHEPTMVLPTPPADGVEPSGRALPAGVAATLRELMLSVVEEGTATAARLPGEPVGGKTGTAEFGTASPPRTHAWFIGFRGDLAVAVLVEDAGFGGSVAAPVARNFFAALD